ncbi:MAG TPA: hypothetical protein VKD69_23380 [Vicinamibacterales bacterium]|nr:hypothetical protein [Vicinamibacterales bacterium]
MSRVAALVALLLWSAAPAAAQSRGVEVFGGYAVVHDAKNDITLPAGWLAGGALQITRWLSAVADVSGGYRTDDLFGAELDMRVHGVVAGGRASARLGRVTEFVQLLGGVVRGSGVAFGFTDTTNAFALQPGVGIDYPLSSRIAARGQLDARFIRNQPAGNEAGYEYRFSVALVYRVR